MTMLSFSEVNEQLKRLAGKRYSSLGVDSSNPADQGAPISVQWRGYIDGLGHTDQHRTAVGMLDQMARMVRGAESDGQQNIDAVGELPSVEPVADIALLQNGQIKVKTVADEGAPF